MINEFKKYLKRDKKSLKTITLYSDIIEQFIDWYTEYHTCEFHCIKREDVLEFKDYLKNNKNFKLSTIKVKLSALSKYNEFLAHCNINRRTPLNYLKK